MVEVPPTPRWRPLRHHPEQWRLWTSDARYRIVPSGRRCLAEGTLVATPSGSRAIESLRVGDEVIGFDMEGPCVTTVTATWDNGVQQVTDLQSAGRTYLSATANHRLWACPESDLDRRLRRPAQGYRRVPVQEIDTRWRIRRSYADQLILGGAKSIPCAYSLGALLGDGCSRESKTQNAINPGARQTVLAVSSDDHIVPAAIAAEVGGSARRKHASNYTWAVDVGPGAIDAVPFYREWAAGRYAHEKIAPWHEIDTWDRESALAFLAGVVDTDGSIYFKTPERRELVVNIAMQARDVVESCARIIHKFLQESPAVSVDRRDRYKNGPVYSIKNRGNIDALRLLEALRPYLRKKGRLDTSNIRVRNTRPDRIGLQHSDGERRKVRTFDITVDLWTNLYTLHDGGIVTSNSGKSELAKRHLVSQAIDWTKPSRRYFAAAPTRDQAKRIYWEDLKALVPKDSMAKAPSETELGISLINGCYIGVVGMDRPERIEGSPWDGGILDEYANMKPQAWTAHVFPALNTPGREPGWCWFVGVPEGRNHYYDMWSDVPRLQAEGHPWDRFTWHSADIIPAEQIEIMRAQMDERTFRQEMLGSFESYAGLAYYSWTDDNIAPVAQLYDPDAPLIFCFDFNTRPGVAAVLQERGPRTLAIHPEQAEEGCTIAIGEVWIPQHSNTPRVCRALLEDWGTHPGEVHLYGDATGGAKTTVAVQGSDWDLIEQELRPVFGDRMSKRVPRANPAERARVNAVNTRIRATDGKIRFFADPKHASHLIRDFERVEAIEGSGELLKVPGSDLSHISDSCGYFIHRKYPCVSAHLLSVDVA